MKEGRPVKRLFLWPRRHSGHWVKCGKDGNGAEKGSNAFGGEVRTVGNVSCCRKKAIYFL